MDTFLVTSSVKPGLQGDLIGLRSGDAMCEFDGARITTYDSFTEARQAAEARRPATVKLKILRGCWLYDYDVTLEPLGLILANRPGKEYQAAYQMATAYANGPVDTSLRGLLSRAVGRDVMINASSPEKFAPARLAGLSDDFFTIIIPPGLVHTPISQIVSITEVSGQLAIVVNHLVLPKGAQGFVGFGIISLPLE